MNMAYRELGTHTAMNRKTMGPNLKVCRLYTDSKTEVDKSQVLAFGYNWSFGNSRCCCISSPLQTSSHLNTWRLSLDSTALNTGGPKSVLYEHADTESKTNDWAGCVGKVQQKVEAQF
jgi:hypothetical protein